MINHVAIKSAIHEVLFTNVMAPTTDWFLPCHTVGFWFNLYIYSDVIAKRFTKLYAGKCFGLILQYKMINKSPEHSRLIVNLLMFLLNIGAVPGVVCNP